jgi:hypothetical protein
MNLIHSRWKCMNMDEFHSWMRTWYFYVLNKLFTLKINITLTLLYTRASNMFHDLQWNGWMYFVTNIISPFHVHTSLLATSLAHVHNNNLLTFNSMTFNIKTSMIFLDFCNYHILGSISTLKKNVSFFFKMNSKVCSCWKFFHKTFPKEGFSPLYY